MKLASAIHALGLSSELLVPRETLGVPVEWCEVTKKYYAVKRPIVCSMFEEYLEWLLPSIGDSDLERQIFSLAIKTDIRSCVVCTFTEVFRTFTTKTSYTAA